MAAVTPAMSRALTYEMLEAGYHAAMTAEYQPRMFLTTLSVIDAAGRLGQPAYEAHMEALAWEAAHVIFGAISAPTLLVRDAGYWVLSGGALPYRKTGTNVPTDTYASFDRNAESFWRGQSA